jgi:hypothetical protein
MSATKIKKKIYIPIFLDLVLGMNIFLMNPFDDWIGEAMQV